MSLPYFAECPDIGQGVVRAMIDTEGRIILMCDEDGTVWLHPDDIGTDRFAQPSGPDWSLPNGDHVLPGTTRWATLEEIGSVGWTSYLSS